MWGIPGPAAVQHSCLEIALHVFMGWVCAMTSGSRPHSALESVGLLDKQYTGWSKRHDSISCLEIGREEHLGWMFWQINTRKALFSLALCSLSPHLGPGKEGFEGGFDWNVNRLVGAKSLQSCLTLCDSMDCSPPGSSVHGILQTRILEWAAMPSSRCLPDPGMETASLMSPILAGGFFTTSTTWKAHCQWTTSQQLIMGWSRLENYSASFS